MALRAMICTQCSSPLQLDDKNEFGYCNHCGTKIQIREIYEVRHTFDGDGFAEKRKILADRAYAAQNYMDAEKYYMSALENQPNNIDCLYRKAICSIVNSRKPDLRITEFETYMGDVRKEVAKMSDRNQQRVYAVKIDKELTDLLAKMLRIYRSFDNNKVSDEYCRFKEREWGNAIDLCNAVIRFIFEEKALEYALGISIEFCDKGWHKSINYNVIVSGQDGNMLNPVTYTCSNGLHTKIRTARLAFAERYNNLPYKINALKNLDSQREKLDSRAQSIKNRMNNPDLKIVYNTENPLKNRKNRKVTLYLSIPIMLWFLLCIFYGYLSIGSNTDWLVIITMLASLIAFLAFVGEVIFWGGLLLKYNNDCNDEKQRFRMMNSKQYEIYRADCKALQNVENEIAQIENQRKSILNRNK